MRSTLKTLPNHNLCKSLITSSKSKISPPPMMRSKPLVTSWVAWKIVPTLVMQARWRMFLVLQRTDIRSGCHPSLLINDPTSSSNPRTLTPISTEARMHLLILLNCSRTSSGAMTLSRNSTNTRRLHGRWKRKELIYVSKYPATSFSRDHLVSTST